MLNAVMYWELTGLLVSMIPVNVFVFDWTE